MIAQIAAGLSRWSRAGAVAASGLALFVMAYALSRNIGAGPLCGQGLSLALFWLNLQLLDLPAWSLQWTAMLCAMMLPLLIQPLEHIERTTFRRHLPRAVALFVGAYLAAWTGAGVFVMFAALLTGQLLAPAAAVWGVLAGALLWSASPAAQRARNRAHRLPPLAVHGWAAWRDCLRFGGQAGTWCVLACWPWMLLCELVPGSRLLVVPALGLVLLAERAMPPTRPRWQLPRIVAFLIAVRPYRPLAQR